jgi:hypothetical protein
MEPPFLIGNASSIASHIAVPVFAPTDAPIPHFHGTNRPFQIIVGARKINLIVALNKPWSQMGHHLQHMAKTKPFIFCSLLFLQKASEIVKPSSKRIPSLRSP